jgi:hypothetical protein
MSIDDLLKIVSDDTELLTIKEVAIILRMNVRSISRYIESGSMLRDKIKLVLEECQFEIDWCLKNIGIENDRTEAAQQKALKKIKDIIER